MVAQPVCNSNNSGCAVLDPSFIDHGNGIIEFVGYSTANNGSSHQWYFGEPGPAGTEQNPIHVYRNSGTYTISYFYTQSSGSTTCCEFEIEVEVNTSSCHPGELPCGDISPQFTLYSSGIAEFTSSAPLNSEDVHIWDFGDGNQAYVKNAVYEFPSTGVYQVTYKYFDKSTGNTYCCILEVNVETHTTGTPCENESQANFSVSRCHSRYVQFYPEYTLEDMTTVPHTWDFGDGNTSTEASPSHLYDAPGIYLVIHTVTIHGVEFCWSEYINTTNHSDAPVIGEPGVDITYTASGINPSQTDYLILGNLIMDANANVSLSTWTMGEGAKIKVDAFKAVQFEDCNLTRCLKLWEGINVVENGSLKLLSTTVNGAHTGTHLQRYTSFECEGGYYSNNIVGIDADMNTQSSAGLNLFRLEGTSIVNTPQDYITDRPLLFYNNMPSIPAGSPNGLKLTGVSVTVQIGKEVIHNGVANRFEFLRTGIRAHSSNSIVRNCYFDVVEVGVNLSDGADMRFKGETYSTNVNAEPTFIGSLECFNVRESTLEASRFKAIKSGTGVHARKMAGRVFKVYNAYMEVYDYGVLGKFFLPYKSNEPPFIHNIIFDMIGAGVTGNNAHGIYLVESGNTGGSGGTFDIYDCDFNTYNGIKGGFFGSKVEDVRVYQNTFNLQNIGTQYGIRYDGAEACEASNNTLLGNGIGSQYDSKGIFINNSTNLDLSCNIMRNTTVGMQLGGACGGTDIRGNTFQDHVDGLHYTFSTVNPSGVLAQTGSQEGRGNIWKNDNFTNAAARNDGSNSLALLSQYLIHLGPSSVTATGDNYWPPTISIGGSIDPTGGNWFVTDPAYPPASCTTTGAFAQYNEGSHQVAQSYIDAGQYTIPVRWMAQLQLYRQLQADTTNSWQSDPVLDSFYQAVAFGSIGDFAFLEASMHDFMTPGGTAYEQLLHYDTLVTQKFEEIFYYDSLALATTGNDSIGYRNSRMQVMNEVLPLLDQRAAYQHTYDSLITVAAHQIRTQSAATPATEVYEQNEVTVNDIYYDVVGNLDSLDGYQIATLQSIADQCPLAGGTAVYRARGMLSDSIYYDDATICGQQGIQYREALIELPTDDVQLFPNPATDYIQLQGLEDHVTATVHDVSGRMLLHQSVSPQSNRVDVSKLTAGMYLITIVQDGAIIHTEKLVIQ